MRIPPAPLKKPGQHGDCTESRLVTIWQQSAHRTDLVTEEGEPVTIIYPGRINTDQGADLQDAVIATGQGLIIGDVEIHVRSSSWWAHQHHRDPHYNRVVLHVVFWHDAGIAAVLQNGTPVPTLALHKYLAGLPESPAGSAISAPGLDIPCRNALARRGMGFIGKLLDTAGAERFHAKASRFQAELTRDEAGQVLYEGIMGALGYAKNKLPFQELARRLPLRILEAVTRSGAATTAILRQQQALLLGTAGLLPSQSINSSWPVKDGWVEQLEQAWAASQQPEAMVETDWHQFKVRPNNFPARRIAAVSYLILRYRRPGLLTGVIDGIRAAPVTRGWRNLERLLAVTAESYWARHFDFGPACPRTTLMLIGDRRAAEIAVNVLLPFAFTWAKIHSQSGLKDRTYELYRHYPRLAGNAIDRHMCRQFGLPGELVGSAQQQQGLLHIYATLCSRGRCGDCPLGTAEMGPEKGLSRFSEDSTRKATAIPPAG